MVSRRAAKFGSHKQIPHALTQSPSPLKKNFFLNGRPSKMMKNTFHVMLKPLFYLKIFKFFSRLFWSCRKRLHKKAKVNLKIYEVTD